MSLFWVLNPPSSPFARGERSGSGERATAVAFIPLCKGGKMGISSFAYSVLSAPSVAKMEFINAQRF